MAERIEVVITGRDGVSKSFVAISKEADRVGESVAKAGEKGAKGMERLKKEATAVGAVMGTLASGVIATGATYRDQERQIDGITRAYGEQSEAILQMTENLQDHTRYSNDAGREAALIASSLAANYDLSAEQISQLIERSADLAQIYGITLPDAVQRTAASLRGEGESAEALSLNMSDAAIAARALEAGITGWSVPGALSEAEKAAFRFKVLMEDSQYATGAAADAAQGAGGKFRELLNEMQDAGQQVGGFLGPIGEVAAEMAPIAMALPVISAGFGRLVPAIRGSSLAMGALGVAFNPVTLGITGVVAGGALLYEAFTRAGEATRDLDADLQSLGDTIEAMKLSGETGNAKRAEAILKEITTVSDALRDGKTAILQAVFELPEGITQLDIIQSAVFDDLQRVMDMSDDFATHINETLSTLTVEQQTIFLDYVNNMLAGAATSMEDSNLDDIMEDILLTPASEIPGVVEAATGALDDLGLSATALSRVVGVLGDGLNGLSVSQKSAASAADALNVATGVTADGLESVAAGHDFAAAAAKAHADTIDGAAAATELFLERQAELLEQLTAVAGLDDPLSQWNLSGTASEFAALADRISDAGTALETTFRAIVGNTNAIGQQVQGIDEWATGLIGVAGTWAEIDALLAEGRISSEQYTAAQEAQTQIMGVNAELQRDILSIQAQQAPLLADLTEAQGAYIDQLAGMPAQQQLIALGWMDSATAARAMEIQTLAVAAAAGEIPEDAFASMITGAAQADPVLKALLVDMGLISEGADGTITVNIDGAEGAISDMDRLTIAMVSLMDLLDNDALDGSISMKVLGIEEVEQAKETVDGLPAEKNVAVNITEGSTGISGVMRNLLNHVTGQGDGTGGAAYTIPVDVDTSAADGYIETLRTNLATPVKVPVEIDLGGLGSSAAGGAAGLAQAAMGQAYNGLDFKVGADTSQAEADIAALSASVTDMDSQVVVNLQDNATTGLLNIGSLMGGLDSMQSLVVVNGDNGSAMQAIGDVSAGMVGIDGMTSMTYVLGDASDAMSSIALARQYDGVTLATSYIDVITRTSQVSASRHGGIPGYAHGGIPVELAESGPEMLHLASGGIVPIFERGIYNVPPNTYVSPANANNAASMGSISVTVNVQGHIMTDESLAEAVAGPLFKALTDEASRLRRAHGAV